MTSFATLWISHLRVQFRQPGYWIMALGLPVSIVLVYGALFAHPNSPVVGIVGKDSVPQVADSVARLERTEGIELHYGDRSTEISALNAGRRWAVVVFSESSGNGDEVAVDIFYSSHDTSESVIGRGIGRELIAAAGLDDGSTGDGSAVREVYLDVRAHRLIDIMFPGVIGMTLMFGNSWAAGTIVLWRQMGILKRFGSSPLHPIVLELSQVLAFATLSFLQVGILLFLGSALFGIRSEGGYLSLALVTGLGSISFMGIWYLFAAVMRTTTAFFSLLNLTAFIMTFLGGSAFPVDHAPAWFGPVAETLPLTHLNRALRDVINDGLSPSGSLGDLAVLALWAVAGFAASVRLFRWTDE